MNFDPGKMASRLLCITISFLLLSAAAYCRPAYSIIQYSQQNGFPANTVYGSYQDHNGYLWISTENGLVRFNGYTFKLFTTRDGMPDNEVFGFKEDRSGRLWFCPFSHTIGFIKNGKIYNSKNDASLRLLNLQVRPEQVYQDDRSGDILIFEDYFSAIHIVSGKARPRRIVNRQCHTCQVSVSRRPDGKICMLNGKYVYLYNNGRFVLNDTISYAASGTMLQQKMLHLMHMGAGLNVAKAMYPKILTSGLPFFRRDAEINNWNGLILVAPGLLGISRNDGFFLVDTATALVVDTLLPGYDVTNATLANDGSIWLSTRGSGIFHLVNSGIKKADIDPGLSVIYIRAGREGMYGISSDGCFIKEMPAGKVSIVATDSREYAQLRLYLGQNRYGDWISCSRAIYKYTHIEKPAAADLLSGDGIMKAVYEDGPTDLIVATPGRVCSVDKDQFRIKDTLFPVRATSITRSGNVIYLGTLKGLMAGTKQDGFQRIFTKVPSVSDHIVKLQTGSDGSVWVVNGRAELTIIRNNKLMAVINDSMGLYCNRISALKASENMMWVGTDNGLYAIQGSPPYRIIRHLTYASGLNSKTINCLDVKEGRVWVGTGNGINYFTEKDVLGPPSSRFVIDNISNGTLDITGQTGLMALPYKTLAINFDLIDYSGTHNPRFQYRFGDDGKWMDIESNNLYFPAVPAGNFTISIRALSPNLKTGTVHHLRFYRPYPFYMTWWFLSLAILLLVAVLAGAGMLIIRRLNIKERRRSAIQRQLLQLQQLALRGQMNPHFIFNCIAAIKQQYTLGNAKKAGVFVDTFASLIRQTFEMGTHTFVSLDKELNYITSYLHLENIRFNNLFDFDIVKETLLPDENIPVPAMLLQPVIENAIRHGVRHLEDRRGKIRISVVQQEERITITVTDNGIGRARSSSLRRRLTDKKDMTSTTVNTRRVDILNRLFEQRVIYQTEDVPDETGAVAGTSVTISYPLNLQTFIPGETETDYESYNR